MASKLRLPYCFETTCPHCGQTNRVITANAERLTIVECDIEEQPGCGQSYVVEAKIEVVAIGTFTINEVHNG